MAPDGHVVFVFQDPGFPRDPIGFIGIIGILRDPKGSQGIPGNQFLAILACLVWFGLVPGFPGDPIGFIEIPISLWAL